MKAILALDIETTGLSPWHDSIHMCGLYDWTNYLPVRDAKNLSPLITEGYETFDIVGHNTQFDIKFLQVQGWLSKEDLEGRVVHDTKIMGALLKERVPKAFLDSYELMRKEVNKSLPKGISHREGSPLSLKVMAPWYLKIPPFWETPGDHNNEAYNEKDCLYTYGLFQLLGKRLQAEGSWEFYTNRMLEWSKMVREMEIKGISISMEELDLVEQEYLTKREHLKNKLDALWMGEIGRAHV